MAKITSARRNKLIEERKQLRQRKKEAAQAKAAAVSAHGDVSENEEYSAALKELTSCIAMEQKIEDTLAGSIVVSENNGPRITIGSRVKIQRLQKNGEKDGEPIILTLEDVGDPVQQNTLGVESPLGDAILNGTDGIYTLPVKNGIKYEVTKLRSGMDELDSTKTVESVKEEMQSFA